MNEDNEEKDIDSKSKNEEELYVSAEEKLKLDKNEEQEYIQTKKDNTTANILSIISMVCFLSKFGIIAKGVGVILLLYTSIKYPKNTLTKVIAILFIVAGSMRILSWVHLIWYCSGKA